jgi:hypothetical protein
MQSCNRFLDEYENYCIINCLLELNSPDASLICVVQVLSIHCILRGLFQHRFLILEVVACRNSAAARL